MSDAVPQQNMTVSYLKLCFWASLILIEAICLSIAFDFGILIDDIATTSWWQPIVGRAGQVPRVAVAATLAALLHGGFAWRDEVLGWCNHLNDGKHVLFRTILHFLTLGAFTALTARLTDPSGEVWSNLGGIVLWLGLGLATVLTWVGIILPLSKWLGFLQRRGTSLLVGAVIGILAWAAGSATALLWKPMAGATLEIVRLLVTPLLGGEIIYDPANRILGTNSFSVEISPDCSGYEGIGLVWVILGAYLWLFRRDLRFPHALILLPIGTILIWITNSLRIAALLLLGVWVSPTIAAGGFHSQAGWIALNGVILGLILLSRRSKWMTRFETSLQTNVVNPTGPYLVPFMALLATIILSSAFTAGFDWLYPLRLITVSAALLNYRKSYRDIRVSSWPVALGVGVVVLFVWMGLERSRPTDGKELANTVAALSVWKRWIWLIARVIGSCVLVPIVEELAFRGFLARRITSSDFDQIDPKQISWPALILSSLAFGSIHQNRLIAGTLAGLLYGYAYKRRGSLGDAIIAHAVTNAMIATLVIGNNAWYLWK
jgi:exosortase E/protease (VPEID-CTERM system)